MLFLTMIAMSHFTFSGYLHCEVLFLNKPQKREIAYGGSTIYVLTKPHVFRIVHLKNDFYFKAELKETGEVFVDEYLSDYQNEVFSGLHLPKVYEQMINYFGKENIRKITLINAQDPIPDFLQVYEY
ncbi:hypothetical protein K2X05_07940 [bacterium]|nr:hypothetical protein [bacterium]